MQVDLHPSLSGGPVSKEMLEGLAQELSFPPEEYLARINRIRQEMDHRNIDVLLVQHPSSVMYVSGFQTFSMNNGETDILPKDDDPCLVVHAPEVGGALLHTWIGNVHAFPPNESFESYISNLVKESGYGSATLGIEMRSPAVSAGSYKQLEEKLPDALIIDASSVLDGVRLLKSDLELEFLQKAATFTDQGMLAAINATSVGATDNEIAASAYHAMAKSGSDYLSNCVIVTAGRRSGILHSTYKRNLIKNGDPVLLEMGGCYQRYTSPLMRSVSIGEPSKAVYDVMQACLKALGNVLSTIRPGLIGDEVARAGWEALNEAGSGLVSHGNFGYGVGIGYPPSWADWTGKIELGVDTVLRPGMVFHHPIALRKLGEFGVCVSETSVVTDTGARVFGSVGREMFLK